MVTKKMNNVDLRAEGIGRREVLSFARLDGLLDAPLDGFDARLAALVESTRSLEVSLAIPTGRVDAAPAPGATVTWPRLYDHQVRRIERPDREAEFRMARRYEFARARAADALTRVGMDEEQRIATLKQGSSALELPAGRNRNRSQSWASQCLVELEMLRNLYVEQSLYVVLACVPRYRNLGIDTPDLVQEGNASLFQAIDGFDWRRDVRFKTYAQYWVHQAMLKALYNASRTVRVPVWVQKALRKIDRAAAAMRSEGREPTSETIGEQLDLPANRVEELLATRRRSVSLDATVGSGDGGTLAQLLPDDSAESVEDLVGDGNLREQLDAMLADLPSREQMILDRRFGLSGSEPETLGEIATDLGITAERVRQLQKAALGRLQRPAKLQRLVAFA